MVLAVSHSPRLDAASQGQRIFSGNPCPQCASPLRYTTSGQCVACAKKAANGRAERLRTLLKDAQSAEGRE